MTTTTVPDRIERELLLPHPIEKVWAAITEPAQLVQWFGQTAEVDLRPGGAMLLGWDEHGTSDALVEAVDPPTRFAFWWPAGDGPLTEENRTLVDFNLAPTDDGGTRLQLVESGFAALASGAAQHADNTGGWEAELGDLVAYLDDASV